MWEGGGSTCATDVSRLSQASPGTREGVGEGAENGKEKGRHILERSTSDVGGTQRDDNNPTPTAIASIN